MNAPTPPKALSEPGYLQVLLPLFALTFAAWIDHLVMVPLSADISQDTGLALERSGLLVSVYPAAAAISAFIFAPYSDRLGRKRMLLILGAGFTLATLGCALAQDVPTILWFRVLSGAFAGPIMPNCLAYAGDAFRGNGRSRAITHIMLGFTIASIVGVPLGSWLAEATSWRWAFGVITLLAAAATGFLLTLPNIPTGALGKILAQYGEMLGLLKRSEVRLVFTMQFFMLIGLFGFIPSLSAWLTANFGMSASAIGIAYMQGGIGSLVGNQSAGWLLKKGLRLSLIGGGSLLMGAVLVVATQEVIPAAWSGAMFFGIMLGGSIRMPGLQAVLSDLTGIEIRGRLMAMSMIVSNLTMGLGGFWSAAILHMENGRLEGMPLVGVIAFACLALVPVLAWRIRLRLTPAEGSGQTP